MNAFVQGLLGGAVGLFVAQAIINSGGNQQWAIVALSFAVAALFIKECTNN